MSACITGMFALKRYNETLSELHAALEAGASEARVERLRTAAVAHVESFLDAYIAIYKDKPRG